MSSEIEYVGSIQGGPMTTKAPQAVDEELALIKEALAMLLEPQATPMHLHQTAEGRTIEGCTPSCRYARAARLLERLRAGKVTERESLERQVREDRNDAGNRDTVMERAARLDELRRTKPTDKERSPI